MKKLCSQENLPPNREKSKVNHDGPRTWITASPEDVLAVVGADGTGGSPVGSRGGQKSGSAAAAGAAELRARQ